MAKRIVILHSQDLVTDCISHLLSAMTDIDAPEPADAIEILPAIYILYVQALCMADDLAAFLFEGGIVRVWMNHMLSIHRPNGFFRYLLFSHTCLATVPSKFGTISSREVDKKIVPKVGTMDKIIFFGH